MECSVHLLRLKAKEMKSLNLMDIEGCEAGCVAPVWRHNSDPLDAHMVTIKARLLLQRYPLGYSHCAGSKKRSLCILCGEEEETIEHFLLTCPCLAKTRGKYLNQLLGLLVEHLSCPSDRVVTQLTVELILTPARYVETDVVPLFEQATRRLVYRLHCARSRALDQ